MIKVSQCEFKFISMKKTGQYLLIGLFSLSAPKADL